MTDNKLKSAVEELESYKKLEAKILRYRETVRRKRDKLCSIKICDFKEPVRGGQSGWSDWRERLIYEIENSERHWAAALAELEHLQIKLEEKMDKLPYPECEILKMKYIDGACFEEMACRLKKIRDDGNTYSYYSVKNRAVRARQLYAEKYF